MLAFTDIGHGPSVVFVLHGWFGDHGVWRQLIPLLDTARYRYLFVDQRGYGGSAHLPGPYSMAQTSEDVRALAASLGVARYVVVGHSMGGMAAQHIAIDAPAAVKAWVGITPVPASGAALPPEVFSFFQSAASDAGAAAGVVDTSVGHRLTPAFTAGILAHKAATVRPEVFAAYLPAFARTDFSADTHRYTGPCLVLAGEHDQGVSQAMVQATFPRHWPQARLQTLPNSGHYPMLETPAHLVAVLEAFLREVDEGSADRPRHVTP